MDFKPVVSYFKLAEHIWIDPVFLFPPSLPPPPPFLQTQRKMLAEVFKPFTSGSQGTKSRTAPSLLREPLAPTPREHSWEGRAGGAEPRSSLPSPLLPPPHGGLKIKIPTKCVIPCLSSTLIRFGEKHACTKYNSCARICCPAQCFVSKTLVGVS